MLWAKGSAPGIRSRVSTLQVYEACVPQGAQGQRQTRWPGAVAAVPPGLRVCCARGSAAGEAPPGRHLALGRWWGALRWVAQPSTAPYCSATPTTPASLASAALAPQAGQRLLCLWQAKRAIQAPLVPPEATRGLESGRAGAPARPPPRQKGASSPAHPGERRHRSRYLSHAKRALYHLS